MSSDTKTARGGIGFGSLLGLAFVVLRLCHVIAWPWVWVLAPFWVPLALLLLIIVIVLAVAVVKKS